MNSYNIIDNYLWLACRFMPDLQVEVKEGDVIRFGRIPFKIAKLVLDPTNQKASQGDISVSHDENYFVSRNNRSDADQSVDQLNRISSIPNTRPLNTSAVNQTTFIEDNSSRMEQPI